MLRTGERLLLWNEISGVAGDEMIGKVMEERLRETEKSSVVDEGGVTLRGGAVCPSAVECGRCGERFGID